MDPYQKAWASCLVPILMIYAIFEIRRGWRVLRHKEPSLASNQRMYVGIVRFLKGNWAADKNYERLIKDVDQMRFYAWSSLVGGFFTLIVCFIWIMMIRLEG